MVTAAASPRHTGGDGERVGLLRFAWTEFARGTGGFALVVLSGTGLVLMFTASGWAGEWMSAARDQRTILIIVLPMTLTLATWQAGRERRRGVRELLASAVRPTWQRDLVSAAGLLLAAWAAHLVVFAACAVVLLRQSTMDSWWWLAVLGLGLAAYPAAVGVGWLIGRMLPGRVVAPLAGIAAFLAIGVPSYSDHPLVALLPNGGELGWIDRRPAVPGAAAFVVLWLAVAATAFLFAGDPCSRLLAIIAGLVVVATLWWVDAQADSSRWFVVRDPRAGQFVCTATGPRVCVLTAHATWLGRTAAVVQPVLSRSADLARMGAAEDPWGDRPGPPMQPLDLYTQIPLWGSQLTSPESLRLNAAAGPFLGCPTDPNEPPLGFGPLANAWQALLLPDDPGIVFEDYRPVVDRIRSASPQRQREFLAAYFVAGRRCDPAALAELERVWGVRP